MRSIPNSKVPTIAMIARIVALAAKDEQPVAVAVAAPEPSVPMAVMAAWQADQDTMAAAREKRARKAAKRR